MKLKIEIDLDDLPRDHHDHHNRYEHSSNLPTVPANYNTLEGLDNGKVWYKQYNKGSIKWVRCEGRGESPTECGNIIIRMSPGNTDVLEDEEMFRDVSGVDVAYDDYPNDMYIQSERLAQLSDMGYIEGENNFIELV